MTDRLAETEALLAVLDAGSVAGGARRLGLTPSAASRLLARLEARLGVRLARRTTRSLQPTEEGLAYAAEARAVLDRLAAAETAAGSARAAPSGCLRVSASLSYGLGRVMPRLAAFRVAYPRIELDIALTDRVIDLAAEGVDVAVRVGPLRPVAGLRARRIEETRHLIVAAPAYLAARGEPNTRRTCVTTSGSTSASRAPARRGRSPWAAGGCEFRRARRCGPTAARA